MIRTASPRLPRLAATTALLLAFTLQPHACSLDTLWQTYFDAGTKAQAAGNCREALKQLNAALKEARTFDVKDARLRKTLRALSVQYISDGECSLAAETLNELAKLDDKYESDSSDTAADLASLGTVQSQESDFSAAESSFQQVISILDKKPDQCWQDLANSLCVLASVYTDEDKYSDAEATLKKAIALTEAGAERQGVLAKCLSNLGELYRRQSKFAEAEPLLKRALSIHEGLGAAAGGSLSQDLSNLGKLYAESGRNPEAETYFKRALSLSERSFGADSLPASVALQDMADFYMSQDRFSDAITNLQTALGISRAKLGTSHPQLSLILRKLSAAQMQSVQYDDAEKNAKLALSIDGTAYGASSRDVADDLAALGRVYLQQGKYQPAENVYLKSLAIVEKVCGPNHADTATCLNNLALVYVNEGKYDKAEPLIQRGLNIRLKTLDKNHPAVARSYSLLSTVAESRGDWSQAETLLKRTIEIDLGVLESTHPDVLATLRELAWVCENQKKWKEVEGCYKRLLDADEKQYGSEDSRVVADLLAMAKALREGGKSDEAKPLEARALYLKDKLPGAVFSQPGIELARPDDADQFSRPIKDKWALVIGISNFKNPSMNLRFAAKDATDFRNYLVNEAHFKPNHVKLLTDSDATRQAIVSNLGSGWLQRLANRDDLVVIYISSHGTTMPTDAGKTNFLIPSDCDRSNVILSGISLAIFTSGIRETLHCGRIIVVLDVCHGGAAGGDTATGSKDLKRRREAAIDSAKLEPGNGQIILASSQSDQVSWESMHYANSVFTHRLLEGLRRDKDATKLMPAFEYTRDKVEEEVLRDRAEVQTPVLITRWWKGEDLSLAVPPTEPRPGLGTTQSALVPARELRTKSPRKLN